MMPKIARFLSLVFLSLVCAYLILISGISLFMGLANTHRTGFWMPILCGLLLLILISFLVRLIIYIIRRARTSDKHLHI